jgi:hypothetical protein
MSVYVFGRELELAPNDNQLGIGVNVLARADLAVTATGTTSALIDTAVSYTATVANSGPNASAATTLVVQAPAGISILTRTPSVGTCAAAGATITCDLGALASGASATVALTGTATVVGTQSWSSSVTTSAEDSGAVNNTASFNTAVTAAPAPPSGGGGGSSGGGGGGRLDWLAVLLLGALLLSRAVNTTRPRVSARR